MFSMFVKTSSFENQLICSPKKSSYLDRSVLTNWKYIYFRKNNSSSHNPMWKQEPIVLTKMWELPNIGSGISKSHSKQKSTNHQICILSFQYISKNMKGWLKFCTSYLAYIQIWLNLSMDDGQFLVHLPIDDHHHIGSLIVEWALSTVQHSLKCPTMFQLSCASNLWITLPTKRIDLLV